MAYIDRVQKLHYTSFFFHSRANNEIDFLLRTWSIEHELDICANTM